MDFLRRFFLRLTEPSTWGAVSVLSLGFGATRDRRRIFPGGYAPPH